jgi:hypothetical protein
MIEHSVLFRSAPSEKKTGSGLTSILIWTWIQHFHINLDPVHNVIEYGSIADPDPVPQ